jgi:hypothetical protein
LSCGSNKVPAVPIIYEAISIIIDLIESAVNTLIVQPSLTGIVPDLSPQILVRGIDAGISDANDDRTALRQTVPCIYGLDETDVILLRKQRIVRAAEKTQHRKGLAIFNVLELRNLSCCYL